MTTDEPTDVIDLSQHREARRKGLERDFRAAVLRNVPPRKDDPGKERTAVATQISAAPALDQQDREPYRTYRKARTYDRALDLYEEVDGLLRSFAANNGDDVRPALNVLRELIEEWELES